MVRGQRFASPDEGPRREVRFQWEGVSIGGAYPKSIE
jgi:hypothetical protein